MTFLRMPHPNPVCGRSPSDRRAFTFPDLLVVMAVIAVLVAVAIPVISRTSSAAHKARCIDNLRQVTRAVLMYADDHRGTLPALKPGSPELTWWYYKEMVKGYVGLRGPSSPSDRVFACPDDRGYEEPHPFYLTKRFYYQSYVFNGVNVPGIPNVAGRTVASIKAPAKTLLMMEWSAHAPLSWHDSKTGNKNHPFYSDAESVVGFVDGHVNYIRLYYDGVNPAYTWDPISGYDYKFSGD